MYTYIYCNAKPVKSQEKTVILWRDPKRKCKKKGLLLKITAHTYYLAYYLDYVICFREKQSFRESLCFYFSFSLRKALMMSWIS